MSAHTMCAIIVGVFGMFVGPQANKWSDVGSFFLDGCNFRG